MKRSTPIKRSPLVRKAPDKATLTIKPRKAKCKHCGTAFERFDMRKTWCSPECGAHLALKALEKARQKAKAAEKREDTAKRKSQMTRSDWIKKARAAVNRYCRLRDIAAGKGCITCGARPEARFGGAFDAGHWRSVGSAPQLQFWTSQIRLQCVKCNRYGGGRAVEFRMALVAERGEAWVQSIEAANHTAKFSTQYLERLTRIYAARARKKEKQIAMQG